MKDYKQWMKKSKKREIKKLDKGIVDFMRIIYHFFEDLPMFGMLRHIMEEEDKEENKILLFVLKDEEIAKTKHTIHSILGDFNSPNTGICLYDDECGFCKHFKIYR